MASLPRCRQYHVLRRSSLSPDPIILARDLIGQTLVRDTPEGRRAGRIVETEAYRPDDAASHAFRGKTSRNQSMYLNAGHAYVYFIYGVWFALNIVAGAKNFGAAVLVRAIEPLDGVPLMQRRRSKARVEDLARGPGKLATVFDIDRKLDGIDLCAEGPLWLAKAVRPIGPIEVSVRIGITKNAHREWRFFERDSRYVSGPRRVFTTKGGGLERWQISTSAEP